MGITLSQGIQVNFTHEIRTVSHKKLQCIMNIHNTSICRHILCGLVVKQAQTHKRGKVVSPRVFFRLLRSLIGAQNSFSKSTTKILHYHWL